MSIFIPNIQGWLSHKREAPVPLSSTTLQFHQLWKLKERSTLPLRAGVGNKKMYYTKSRTTWNTIMERKSLLPCTFLHHSPTEHTKSVGVDYRHFSGYLQSPGGNSKFPCLWPFPHIFVGLSKAYLRPSKLELCRRCRVFAVSWPCCPACLQLRCWERESLGLLPLNPLWKSRDKA